MEKKVVTFRLGEEEFAFDIMSIVEVIRLKEITEVPTAPSFIEGVINLRGKVIPVVDLRKRFNLEKKERDRNVRIIIAEYNKDQLVGIIVDQVEKVMNINNEFFLPPPPNLMSSGDKYIESIIQLNERIIVLLNVQKIFSKEEQEELKGISESENIKDKEDKL